MCFHAFRDLRARDHVVLLRPSIMISSLAFLFFVRSVIDSKRARLFHHSLYILGFSTCNGTIPLPFLRGMASHFSASSLGEVMWSILFSPVPRLSSPALPGLQDPLLSQISRHFGTQNPKSQSILATGVGFPFDYIKRMAQLTEFFLSIF